ncbi:MAG: ParB/RepB/Spo0J family partition protein [Bacteriovoracaceae bacterium]|nr:ParB/RepB/Spo0J family partition protein [Bacteriovoracaceae bacterium]
MTRSSLGKGMGALLGGGETTNAVMERLGVDKKVTQEKIAGGSIGPESAVAMMLEISKIKTNENQPRKIFKEKELQELSQSIQENGVIQPLVVLQKDNGFELIAGERRLRASKLAGLTKVPVIIKKATKKESLVMAIIENVQRSDLNCVEEALSYYQLMEEFSLTQEEVAKKIGKERSTIANFLRILKLPREVISMVQKEALTFGHAKILSGLKEREDIIRLANRVVAEGLSVRELEKLSTQRSKPLSDKTNPFFNQSAQSFKEKLEKRTGYHFDIASKSNGSGTIKIKFEDEAQFNDIFQFLMK